MGVNKAESIPCTGKPEWTIQTDESGRTTETLTVCVEGEDGYDVGQSAQRRFRDAIIDHYCSSDQRSATFTAQGQITREDPTRSNPLFRATVSKSGLTKMNAVGCVSAAEVQGNPRLRELKATGDRMATQASTPASPKETAEEAFNRLDEMVKDRGLAPKPQTPKVLEGKAVLPDGKLELTYATCERGEAGQIFVDKAMPAFSEKVVNTLAELQRSCREKGGTFGTAPDKTQAVPFESSDEPTDRRMGCDDQLPGRQWTGTLDMNRFKCEIEKK